MKLEKWLGFHWFFLLSVFMYSSIQLACGMSEWVVDSHWELRLFVYTIPTYIVCTGNKLNTVLLAIDPRHPNSSFFFLFFFLSPFPDHWFHCTDWRIVITQSQVCFHRISYFVTFMQWVNFNLQSNSLILKQCYAVPEMKENWSYTTWL